METHNCPINHEGSAGSREAAGLVDYFLNSIENRNLCYTLVYLRDTYSGIVEEKLECVGHKQKCLGSRLRYLKDTMKGPLADGKKIGGKGWAQST